MSRSRLEEVPRMRWGASSVAAESYNRARLALRRLENPLRFATGLRDIDMILEIEVWYCVDCSMNDLPILAWDQFVHRDNLHQPVECRLSYYHQHAQVIQPQVLAALDTYLQCRLQHPRRILGLKF